MLAGASGKRHGHLTLCCVHSAFGWLIKKKNTTSASFRPRYRCARPMHRREGSITIRLFGCKKRCYLSELDHPSHCESVQCITHVLIMQSSPPTGCEQTIWVHAHTQPRAVSAVAPLISHPLLQHVWPRAPSGGKNSWAGGWLQHIPSVDGLINRSSNSAHPSQGII